MKSPPESLLAYSLSPPATPEAKFQPTGAEVCNCQRPTTRWPTWQFTPATARALGLRVGGGVDERLDLHKSTRAGCRYLRNLILDFGAGSSVMLALAAYNLGPTRVKQAIAKVDDPIKQRNFWYLYRVRALPAETREYVPKVFAAIIIGRNPDKFGFQE